MDDVGSGWPLDFGIEVEEVLRSDERRRMCEDMLSIVSLAVVCAELKAPLILASVMSRALRPFVSISCRMLELASSRCTFSDPLWCSVFWLWLRWRIPCGRPLEVPCWVDLISPLRIMRSFSSCVTTIGIFSWMTLVSMTGWMSVRVLPLLTPEPDGAGLSNASA